ncbi:ATP-binding protein [Sphingosinicella sp. CPCC 101087]|uniref:ATP-binding protein n=1 Tax=Sphingosinicella sp. CPCC 101087 TaxID=2497754 RepID=UPI00101DD3C2|nr:ATP-binding protein [Sphingosinicella sp. CPCC 101087]
MAERTFAHLDEHRAYIGASGSGKSTTARVDVEQLLRERRHTCVTDHTGVWYGLRSNRAGTGPGFDIPVFGGRRGDRQLRFGPGDGATIGRVIGDGVSAVIDLSGLRSGAEQRAFMRDFVGALRRKPAGHFQLVADEADEDVPEKTRDEAGFELQEDMIWIAKRGRSDGFVLSMITQRPASIAKEALSQAQAIFAHQLTAPTDTKAFGAYIRAHGTKAEHDEIMARLPSLQVGERYLYRPRDHVLELGRTPMPQTFDSSRTPDPGEAKREPKMLSEIDVSAIAAALQKPKVETAIAAYEAGAEVGQLLVEKDARIRALEAELASFKASAERYSAIAASYHGCLADVARLVGQVLPSSDNNSNLSSVGTEEEIPPSRRGSPAEGEARANPKRSSGASPTPPSGDQDKSLQRGRKALLALARIYPAMLTEPQWATLAGYAKTGGTWGTYKSALRSAGLVEETRGLWGATKAGLAAAGVEPEPLPDPGPDLALFWSARIPGVRRMVDVLVKRWPHFVTREGLAADLAMSAKGGTFGTYLGRLRSNGLLEEQKTRVRLAPSIMGSGR